MNGTSQMTNPALVQPELEGVYQWSWIDDDCISSPTGRETSIMWDGPGSSSNLEISFLAEGAVLPVFDNRTIFKCSHTDDPESTDDDDDYDPQPHDDWCHVHARWISVCHNLNLDPEDCAVGNSESDPESGLPVNAGDPIAVNNDDDDGDGTLDLSDTDGVTGDDDFIKIYPFSPYTGGCCPCPEHNPSASTTATRLSCSGNLRTWGDAAKTTQCTSVGRGDAVYVEAIGAGTYIGGDKILWQWTEDNETHIKTNIYTIFSLRMFADLNFDDTINSNDYAGVSQLTSHGWIMQVASNALHKVELKTDVLIPGYLILSLSGTATVRVWTTATPATNDTPLLITGQSVTNGIDGANFALYPESMIYVEAIDSGTASLTYSYVGTGEDATGLSCSAILNMTAVKVDLKIDSNNDNTISELDDAIEDIQGDVSKPGKLIHVNDDDTDHDFIPDYADGINRDGLSGTDDDAISGEYFTPIVLKLAAPIDLTVARLTVVYSAACPADIEKTGASPEYEFSPGIGTMRIWTLDGNQNRSTNSVSASVPGNYIPCGTYEPSQLGFSETTREKTFYIEGINPSSAVASTQVSVKLDIDGDGPLENTVSDSVRVTVIKIDLDAGNNSNECTEEIPGTPVMFNDDWDGQQKYGASPPTGHYEKEPVWDYQYTDGEIAAEDDLMQIRIAVSPSTLAGNVVLTIPSGALNICLWPRLTKGTIGEKVTVSTEGTIYAVSSLPAEDLYLEGVAVGRTEIKLDYTFGAVTFSDKLNVDIVTVEEAQGGIRKIIYDYGDTGDPMLFQIKPSTLSSQYTCLWDQDGDGTHDNGTWESSRTKITTVKYSSAVSGSGNVQLPQTSYNRRKVYNCSVKLKGGELKGGLVLEKDIRVALGTHQGVTPVSDPGLRCVEVNGLATPPSGYSDTELPSATSNKFSQAWFEDSPPSLCYDVSQSVNSYRLQYSPRVASYGITAFTGVGFSKKVYLSMVCAFAYDEGYKLQDLEGVALHECRHAEQLVLCATSGSVFRLLDEYYTVLNGQPLLFILFLEADAYLVSIRSDSDWLTMIEKNFAFWHYYEEGVRPIAPDIMDSQTKSAAKELLQSIYEQIPFIEAKKDGYQYSVKAPE